METKLSKRQRQREQNILRAKKMHGARLEHEIDKSQINNETLPELNIGCSGWFYWHWKGKFYPQDISTGKWFEYYTKHLKTVELNSPFYGWPTVNTVKSWVRQAHDKKFIYTVKVNEMITHIKHFEGTKTMIKDFGLIADILGPYMGCFLFQLPPSFHYTQARLKAITQQLDPARKNVVEFRHASWWNDKVYNAFEKAGIIFCSCSAPNLPDELIKTADDIYIRFHGSVKWYDHDYSKKELETWAKNMRKADARHIWAYFNNDRNANSVKNARELFNLLKRN